MTIPDELVVGCVQMHSVLEPADNLRRCLEHLTTAERLGVRLLVFPESTSSRSDDPLIRPIAEPLDSGFVPALAAAAAEHGITVVVGVMEAGPAERPYNTLVALQGGRVVSVYRKLHLYDAAGTRESDTVMPGDGPLTAFEVAGFRISMMTCYDIRFPELARLLAGLGADLIAIPTSWMRGPMKEMHWLTFCRARAIENTVYIAGSCQTGGDRIGRTTIVAPDGIAEASSGIDEGLIVARVASARLGRVRANFPMLEQTRFDIDAAPRPAGVSRRGRQT